MPKVWVFGKEGSTALHCQEPGQTSLGLRHLRPFGQKGAVGPALPKSWANGNPGQFFKKNSHGDVSK